MSGEVIVIPAKVQTHAGPFGGGKAKRRVAGYARVSTDRDEQLSSFEAQLDYFTRMIENREDWVFAGMYSDEGKTGTMIRPRNGFNAMVKDCLEGKIDLVITKSVSRFARNTVDSLSTIRRLKEKGVELFFEKENIWTMDAKGELLITIMSSLSQEESRSISENTVWGMRKRFADGKWSMGYSRFLGYERGEDGGLVINAEQAKVVREIYAMFLNGMSYSAIARSLTERGVKAPAGGDIWYARSVMSILQNEKYSGDVLLQKTFTTDFLTKKRKVNAGQIPQYFIKGDHEPIIAPSVFALVQEEIRKRGRKRGKREG